MRIKGRNARYYINRVRRKVDQNGFALRSAGRMKEKNYMSVDDIAILFGK